VQGEGGECHLLVRLFSLNQEHIELAFKNVIQTNIGYVLVGKSSFAKDKGENCCSLAYKLLAEGGVKKLRPSESSIMKTAFITPNDFAEFIISAKKAELELYPHTKDFATIENEYTPPERSSCTLM
jgi:hypothetical protein